LAFMGETNGRPDKDSCQGNASESVAIRKVTRSASFWEGSGRNWIF